jgi:crossover junction endodeoxyribonuclease RuvC
VHFWLFQRQVTTVPISPATLKKYATGRGNAVKDEMMAAAIHRFCIASDEDNKADAYLLGA